MIILISQVSTGETNNIAKKLVNAIEIQDIEKIKNIISSQQIKYIENLVVQDTPPIFYASTCYPESLKYLIDYGFDVNIYHSGSNLRPIALAAITDNMECYSILKKIGALKFLTRREQYELMGSMIISRNQQVVDDLIEQGYDYLDDQYGLASIEYAIHKDRSYLFVKHIEDKGKSHMSN